MLELRWFWVRVLAAAAVLGVAGCGDFDGGAGPLPAPERIAPALGPTTGGQLVAIEGHGFTAGAAVLFDGVPATDVRVASEAVITCVVPPHAAGSVTVRVYDAEGRFADLEDGYEYVPSFGTEGRPRVVSAVSTGNTSVRVTFSEPVRDGAGDVESFRISQAHVNPESGTLRVLAATPSDDFISVELVTSSQNELVYELSASNIRDFDGNLLAPPELLVNPSVVTFAGTPPSVDELVDADGDGLYDNVELSGWTVTVFLTNGDVVQTSVTSDPDRADSDGDGLSDAEELVAGSSPRSADTDGDTVPDFDEWNVWWSDPCDQDSDDDTLADGIELWLRTSAILDDTDGDGVEDAVEKFELARDPLLADLPRPQIVVGSYDLQVDVTSSYTDETGVVRATQTSASTSVSQATASSQSRSDTRSTQTENRFSQSLGTEISFGGGTTVWGGKVSASVGFEQSEARGYSSTVSSESSRQSSQSWDRSVAEAFESSQSRSITRTVQGARILATINVANDGTVPFTIENLEISVLRQDRAAGGSFRPVATLRPRSELSLSLGPLDSERGPIVFEDSDIFPDVVDEILREPTGLIFRVANFDVTDEDGRNFAYTSATVSSRTAGVTIDYGDGRSDSYRIATSDRFDAEGRPTGISIERALEIIGLTLTPGDAPLPDAPPAGGWPASVRSSVGTLVGTDGVERLVRVGTVQTSLDASDPEKRFWTIQTNDTSLSEDASFSDIRLRAGQEYLIVYVRDLDEDGLYDREELLYGSSDHLADTDRDGISDRDEVREGWAVRLAGSTAYRAFPSPARADSDGDGLEDSAERAAGTDPSRADTDLDGVTDALEATETLEIELFDGDLDDFNDRFLTLVPYSDFVLIDGGNGTFDGTASGDDVVLAGASEGVWLDPGPDGAIDSIAAGDDRITLLQAIAPGADGSCETYVLAGDDVAITTGAAAPDARCVHGGLDGVLQTEAAGDDFVRALHAGMFVLDPLSADTDLDGLPDGRELAVGTNPNARDAGSVTDSDQDGLYDSEETNGWDIVVDGAVTRVTSNPLRPDSDGDGLPDTYERVLGTSPRLTDTDGDSLRDSLEVAMADPWWTDAQRIAAAYRCSAAVRCSFTESSSATHSDPRARDTDGDTLSDGVELTGWTVRVGASVAQVTSSPALADTDGDGLRDDGERTYGTDPRDADTDDDGGSDSAELGQPTWGAAPPRSPTVRDRWVRMRFSATFVDDGETGDGELVGELQARVGSAAVIGYSLRNGCPSEGPCTTQGFSGPVVMTEGDLLTISSTEVCENDGGSDTICDGSDDRLGTWSDTIGFGEISGTSTVGRSHELRAGSTRVDVQLHVEVQ